MVPNWKGKVYRKMLCARLSNKFSVMRLVLIMFYWKKHVFLSYVVDTGTNY